MEIFNNEIKYNGKIFSSEIIKYNADLQVQLAGSVFIGSTSVSSKLLECEISKHSYVIFL